MIEFNPSEAFPKVPEPVKVKVEPTLDERIDNIIEAGAEEMIRVSPAEYNGVCERFRAKFKSGKVTFKYDQEAEMMTVKGK